MSQTSRVTLACLLPARNCADDLAGYFESVARFADAVVALDDGSTDGTAELLAAQPLVRAILTNPRRASYAGWDDAANRTRLLAAAADLHPSFIISIDADERIAPDDAAALREFVQAGAQRDCAYLLRLYGMVEDADHYAGQESWHGRLFGYQEGQVFPTRRLHLVPIPTSIPKSRWIKTTIRIQHIGGLTEERRRLRFQKYQEVDPDCVYQKSYANLIAPKRDVRRWQPRLPNLPVVVHDRVPDLRPQDTGEPALSVIVISQNDKVTIARSLRAIAGQDGIEPFEVIVVNSGTDNTAALVREHFPEVKLVKLERPALPGRARNAGLAIARGRYVSFPGSHIELLPGSLAARIHAHRLGYALVSGTIVNGTRTWAGWASYFLDNRLRLPGRASGPVDYAPPSASYLRAALLAVGNFPEDVRTGEDTVVNHKLFESGYGVYHSPEVRAIHYSPCRYPHQLVHHHFRRGQGMARVWLLEASEKGRFPTRLAARYLITIIPARLVSITLSVFRYGHTIRRHYWVALPLVVIGALSAWAGTCYELVRAWRRSDAAIRRPAHRAKGDATQARRAAGDVPEGADADGTCSPSPMVGGATAAQVPAGAVQERLSTLTNRQKARLLMMTLGDPNSEPVHGAIIVNQNNYLTPSHAEALVHDVEAVRDARGYPPLVGADQEGGIVNRLGKHPQTAAISFPSPKAMQSMTPEQLFQEGVKWGDALKAAGVTMLLGPSMDVVAPGTLMDRQGRAFGATIEEVAARTTAFLEGVREANPTLAVIAKHYPGYSVHENSDDHRVIDSTPAAKVWRRAQPFDTPMIDGVMVSSIIFSNVDGCPACFSKAVIDNFRQKRPDALVMTDDLCARGFAKEDIRENVKRAFKAGCDLLVSLDNRKNKDIESAILGLVKGDPAMQARIDQSAARVLALALRQGRRSGSGFRKSGGWPAGVIRSAMVRRLARGAKRSRLARWVASWK